MTIWGINLELRPISHYCIFGLLTLSFILTHNIFSILENVDFYDFYSYGIFAYIYLFLTTGSTSVDLFAFPESMPCLVSITLHFIHPLSYLQYHLFSWRLYAAQNKSEKFKIKDERWMTRFTFTI